MDDKQLSLIIWAVVITTCLIFLMLFAVIPAYLAVTTK